MRAAVRTVRGGGVWDGERILSEDYVRLATTCRMNQPRRLSEIRKRMIILSGMPSLPAVETFRWGAKLWDFRNHIPDVIVLNLGTNDATVIDLNEDTRAGVAKFEEDHYEFLLILSYIWIRHSL